MSGSPQTSWFLDPTCAQAHETYVFSRSSVRPGPKHHVLSQSKERPSPPKLVLVFYDLMYVQVHKTVCFHTPAYVHVHKSFCAHGLHSDSSKHTQECDISCDWICDRSCNRSCDSSMLIGSTQHMNPSAIKLHLSLCMYLHTSCYIISRTTSIATSTSGLGHVWVRMPAWPWDLDLC